jgi:DNA repair exonuclease SbcCD nuclease subunit
MRLMILGDLHITDKKPKRRLDTDYLETLLEKVFFSMEMVLRDECDAMVLPGDVFDSAKVNHKTVSTVMELLHKVGAPVLAVYGQHDMLYHGRDIENTPLNVLNTSGAVQILNSTTEICGVSWEEPIESDGQKVLVIHQMMSNAHEMFDFTDAKAFLKKHKEFDLIISGDNHKQFVVKDGKRCLVNPGSLMRSTISQIEHKPAMYVWDSKTMVLDRHEIPVKPASEVFDLDYIEEEKEHDAKLEAFIEGLTSTEGITGLDFIKNLRDFVKKNKTKQSVIDLIENKLLLEESA